MRAETIYCSVLLALEVLLAFQLPGTPVAGPTIAGFILLFLGTLAASRDNARKLRYIYAFFLFLIAAATNKGSFAQVTLAVATAIHYFTLTEGFTGARRYAVKKGEPLPLDGRPGIYSLAFGGAVALSYLFLDGSGLNLPLFARGLLGFVAILCGFGLWDIGYVTRLQRATRFRRPAKPLRVRAVQALVIAAVFVTLFLLFGRAIPATAYAIHQTSSEFRKGSNSHGKSPLAADRDRTPDFGGWQSDRNRESQPHKVPAEGNFRTDPSLLLAMEVPDSNARDALVNSRIYIRGYALDAFKDDEWQTPPDGEGEILLDSSDGIEDGRVQVSNENAPPESVILHRLRMLVPFQQTLPAIQGVMAYQLKLLGRKPGDWHTSVTRGAEFYTAESVPSIYDVIKNGDLRVSENVGSQFLAVPHGPLSKDMHQLVERLRGGTLDEKIDGVLGLLRQRCTYSTEITNPGHFSALQNFLYGEKQGMCIHYATAAALLLRIVDVPTRVAFGFSGGEYYTDQELFAFRGHDAHVWVEVLVDNHGWTAIDPTPIDKGAAHKPMLTTAPDDYFDKIAQTAPEPPSKNSGASVSRWLRKLRDLPWGTITAAMLGSIFLIAFVISRKQRRPDESVDGSALTFKAQDAEDPKYLKDLYRLCARRFGVQKLRSETLLEFINELKRAGAIGSEFDSLCDYHYNVYYCGGTRDKAREVQLRDSVKNFAPPSR
ncbi:MAG: hypothetical protein KDN22_30945 [Verrucomicrobiae bacterium]|nr:hypothetical protein [Verrucomicrobiae bacterium]